MIDWNDFRHHFIIRHEGEDDSRLNWRLIAGALSALIISMCGWWWLLKLIAIFIIWSALAADYIINWIEELQLQEYSGLYDLLQRFLVLKSVKKYLVDEVTRPRLGRVFYERSDHIVIPGINVFIDHRHGFDGYIEIELLPEYNDLINDPDFLVKLSGHLRRFANRYSVASMKISATGNKVIYTLADARTDNSIELEPALNKNYDSVNVLDLKHFIDWNQAYHAVISGVTGSGKTKLIEYLLICAKINNWDIRILDPKQSDLARIQESDQIAVACEKDDMLELLHESVKEMQHAQRRYKEDPTVALTPHLIVVDELAALKAMLDRKEQQQLLDDLKQIALLGRQAKFHLIIGVQQANANNVPTEIREQMGIKILLGNSTATERKFLFTDCQINTEIENVGQGIISVNNSPAEIFNVPWITDIDPIEYINS
ncbi:MULTISPECIES: hypothetical protein [Ligilactobacillus]|uniref:hypothetical protein n=1 Tax=Ligilactobacillus TaxID=2767887 RepID=UPI0024BB5365|nr:MULTISPECIES: hypothetical protein [Ligilactobacillus]MDO3392802.1 hypothetical protein [Ligilactobacillus sp. 110_WCHN]